MTGTPKKEKTLAGRVSKSANTTPTKRVASGNVIKGIKEEPESSASSFLMMDTAEEEEASTMNASGYLDMGYEWDEGV